MSDPFSEVLRTVRLTGGVFLDARFTAPWCVAAELTPADCRPLLADPVELVAYHVVIEGSLQVGLADRPVMQVQAGEVVLLPRNDPHTLGSAHGLKALNADELIQPTSAGGLAVIRHGGGGDGTHIVCGFLGNAERAHPLIATLPQVLKIDIRDAASRDWVEASVRYAARELVEGRLATSDTMSRLSELLFVEAVRSYATALGPDATGWLKGLADPQIGRAIALLHSRLEGPWTTDDLAREVALSRSAFNARFATLVGMPPMRYLQYFRMQTAKERLRNSRENIASIAHAVGYDSEQAFNRAFRREFGTPPARWRLGSSSGQRLA
jgi:AraC-like DNA-binding protein